MNYIVVGCGRIGSELAMRLQRKNHKVVVIDSDPKEFANLPPEFNGRTVEGEPLNRDVLNRAGIKDANGLAAVTISDTLNLAIAHAAHEKFNIPNVVVRNYNPENRDLFDTFEYQVVSSSTWGAQRLEELLYHQDMRQVFSAGNGEVELYEFRIPEALEGKTVGELLNEGNTTPAALTRGRQAILPDLNTVLKGDDVLMISATIDGIQAVRRRLRMEKEG